MNVATCVFQLLENTVEFFKCRHWGVEDEKGRGWNFLGTVVVWCVSFSSWGERACLPLISSPARGAPNRSPTKSSLWDLCGWKDTEAGTLTQAWKQSLAEAAWAALITVSEESPHYDESWKHAVPDASRKRGGVVLKGPCAPSFDAEQGDLSRSRWRENCQRPSWGEGQLVSARYCPDKGFHCGESRAGGVPGGPMAAPERRASSSHPPERCHCQTRPFIPSPWSRRSQRKFGDGGRGHRKDLQGRGSQQSCYGFLDSPDQRIIF